MPDGKYPDPREEDIYAGDRRISRPDSSLPDWEVPDTAYRPIPIVWFTGAFVIQMVVVFAIFILLLGQHGAITIALSALVSAAIGAWTWDRGMKDAGTGWKVATIGIMLATFLLVCAGAYDRL
ncbi:hypothetical protein ACI5KX_09095 [Erythrobacter sp. GH1-10]|uniref:hypothetical protein n=1 Tax=Erythrobacter sp. GH1-10 TaxID=3349334 RepID=UPI003877BFF0